MYPESARKVRSWFPCGYLFGETNVEFESYRACTGEFLCYRVAKDYRHDDFNYDEPKRQFLGNVRSFVGTDQYHPSFDDKEFVSYSASLFQHDIGTFSTLEGLGDDLHKWIFVERDFDMLELRLLSMKTIAYHLHGGSGLKWMLLTDAADTPWRGGRHTAADWVMLIRDLLDRVITEAPRTPQEYANYLKCRWALGGFVRSSSRRWTTARHQTTSQTTKTIRLPNVGARSSSKRLVPSSTRTRARSRKTTIACAWTPLWS